MSLDMEILTGIPCEKKPYLYLLSDFLHIVAVNVLIILMV